MSTLEKFFQTGGRYAPSLIRGCGSNGVLLEGGGGGWIMHLALSDGFIVQGSRIGQMYLVISSPMALKLLLA